MKGKEMKHWFKKAWEAVGIGLITVAVVGMVGWWGSYQGTKTTIGHLCDDVNELSQSVKSLAKSFQASQVDMATIKAQLEEAKNMRAGTDQEIGEIKRDVKRTERTLDRHILEYHYIGKKKD